MKDEVFRAYDIRGVYGRDITEEDARLIGLAFATFIGGEGKTFAIGWDVRNSSKSLAASLIDGVVSTGANVLNMGLVPTPMVYFAIAHRKLDGGVIVTASHNPPEWNGFKLCRENAKLCGAGSGLEQVKKIISEKAWKTASKGSVKNIGEEIIKEYEEYLLKTFEGRLGKSKVLIDPGNGSCSKIGGRILRRLGLDVDSINDCPDGRFPSRLPEPTEESLNTLRRMVREKSYDFGVGYDGDCDRALFVDDEGNVIRGDLMLTLFVKHFLKNRAGEKIVYDVSCSKLVEEVCRENGIVPIVSRVGHTFILEKMLSEKAWFGGEISSHLYFGEIYGLDDAIFATLKVAELLALTGRKLSQLTGKLPKYEYFKKNYDVPDEIKFQVIRDLTTFFQEAGCRIITLDGVRVELEEGWFILRASNTLPQVKLTAEASNKQALDKIVSYAEKSFKEILTRYSGKS